MRFLLDTHAVLWAATGDANLPTSVRDQVFVDGAQVHFSAVSGYEMALAYGLGRWPEADALLPRFTDSLRSAGWIELPVSAEHALAAGALPVTHRDPFDRILAAQSLAEDLVLVSRDAGVDAFGVRRLW